MNQSSDLARLIQFEYGPMAAQLCTSASILGWREAPSGVFTLAHDHSLTIDQTGATVVYKGTPNHTGMDMGGPGFVYLPIRLTQLATSRPVDTRRHFIEFFFWQPDTANPPTWRLGWIVYEVVGPDFRPVTGDASLMTITAPLPPTSFEAARAGRVQLNADGEAEWEVDGGSNPRSGVIPFKGRP